MPKQIEDVIREFLREDTQRNALDFIAFLRKNEIPFTESENYLDAHCQGKNVCSILITGTEEAPGPWTIWSDQDPGSWVMWPEGEGEGAHRDPRVDEATRETAWANVNFCASCGGDCSPGKRKTVLGKAFDGLCSSTLAFTNPDEKALDCAKKMVVSRRRDILGDG